MSRTPDRSYYWEDLDIGFSDDFGPYDVERDAVLAFARQFDPQPFHLDEAAAAATHFGRLSASGWHTCAMTMAAMVKRWQAVPGWQAQLLGAMGVDDLRWRRPVYPGDRLHGTSAIVDKIETRSRPDMGLLKWQTQVFNQDDELVLSFVAIIMQRRRPADGDEPVPVAG